jgi:uncharacterized membrane protein
MRNLSTTVAVYDDLGAARADWDSIETASQDGRIDLADAALVAHDAETITTVERQSHHGWGKGAVAGAVVGILFPPALVGSTIVGATGGGVIARMNRSLDRGDIKDLGDVMDSGEIALVVLTSQDTADVAAGLLTGAKRSLTRASSTAEDVMAAMSS